MLCNSLDCMVILTLNLGDQSDEYYSLIQLIIMPESMVVKVFHWAFRALIRTKLVVDKTINMNVITTLQQKGNHRGQYVLLCTKMVAFKS